ncbi:thiamine phosphate synthase [Vibrio porteresiae]|uniref:Thiamine phosphate synthase n=1 Tax=Vibrio porteresiae DSM 19223 TaxID=1123496 RepID=A0ABZ0QDL9_9VIBR|nr:thiamine phosphate synthase [Vibrio porteresiae]WPC74091.1 thiamine phosphate synthase [Vibrio porteresiae DSM 19223]
MMIKIHIPEHWPCSDFAVADFSEQIDQHLSCAKQNGVCSDKLAMTFETVKQPFLSLHFPDLSVIYIDTSFITKSPNEFPFVHEFESVVYLNYVYDSSLQRSALQRQSNRINTSTHPKNELLITTNPDGMDYLISAGKAIQFERLPIDVTTHFSWFVVLLALEFTIEDSLLLARSLGSVSRETLWPQKSQDFACPVDWTFDESGAPFCKEQFSSSVPFPSTTSSAIGLYPVVDNNLWLEQLLKLGVKTVQLRMKNAEEHLREKEIEHAVQLGKSYQAAVYINDYWQLALKHKAYGVHLGQDDISQESIALLQRANIRLGLSTHGYFEILRVYRSYPSYIALGHVFATTTKSMPSRPQGLYKLALYQKFIEELSQSLGLDRIPTVAIGGIQLSNAREVYLTGVDSIAVVRAVSSDQPNLPFVVREFESLKNREGEHA